MLTFWKYRKHIQNRQQSCNNTPCLLNLPQSATFGAISRDWWRWLARENSNGGTVMLIVTALISCFLFVELWFGRCISTICFSKYLLSSLDVVEDEIWRRGQISSWPRCFQAVLALSCGSCRLESPPVLEISPTHAILD